MSGDAELAAVTGPEIADLLEPRIDNAWHERSIWNYRSAQDAEKELGRFCAAHKDAILSALRRLEPAVDAVEAAARALLAYDQGGSLQTPEQLWAGSSEAVRSLHLGRARAALAALPRPEADEGAVERGFDIGFDACRSLYASDLPDPRKDDRYPAWRSAALAAAQEES